MPDPFADIRGVHPRDITRDQFVRYVEMYLSEVLDDGTKTDEEGIEAIMIALMESGDE